MYTPEIIMRDTYAPTNRERRAAWASRYALVAEPMNGPLWQHLERHMAEAFAADGRDQLTEEQGYEAYEY